MNLHRKIMILGLLLCTVFAFGQKYSNGKVPTGDKSRIGSDVLRKGTKPNQVLMTLGDSTVKYVDSDTAFAIVKDTLKLSYFGAVSGSVSTGVRHANTAAFATAWDKIKDIGGVIIVDGIYEIDSLDLQNTTPSNFYNTDIVGTAPSISGFKLYATGIAVGCEGRNWLEMKDLTLQFMSNPEVGLLYCRTASSENCNNNALINVEITGSAQKSLMATIAAESFRVFHSKISNMAAVGGSCYITSVNNTTFAIEASSEAITSNSNTDIVFFGTEFYSSIDSCKVLIMDRAADIKYIGCSFIVGNQPGSSIANFDNSIDVFEGVVLFDGCLFEASENPFKFVCRFSPNYYRNINVRNCFVNNYGFISGIYTDVVKYIGGGSMYHYNFNWEGNRFSSLNPKLKTGILIHSKIYHKCDGATFEPAMLIQCDVDVLAFTNSPTIQASRVMVAGVGIYAHLPQIDNYSDADYTGAPVGAMLVWSAGNTLGETPGNLHIKQ